MQLTDEQENAFRLAKNGHSFVMTGQCGTGKTHLLRCIIKELSMIKQIAVTSATGMASLQLGQNGTTVHHWSGIMDGRFSIEKLKELFDADDRFAAAKLRILSSEVLIIDEIGILSAKVFTLVESVCRHLRKNEAAFGGLQVIASGDFKQLPPVPNYNLQDDGTYCFKSVEFQKTFPHFITLKQVLRQEEPELVRAVHELCDGMPSKETLTFLRNLNKTKDTESEALITKLYGTNFDAAFINQLMLDEMAGKQFTFRANDTRDLKLLKNTNVAAHKTLCLKEGAPIILTRNVGKGLFNGMRGKVHSLKKDCPPVVNIGGHLVELPKVDFDILDYQTHTPIASRKQYPIMLAFALTVHRAQGQTIPFLQIDCCSFFAPGQLGVAVGRCTKSSGLHIINFNERAATIKHPECVYEYYDFKGIDPVDDLSCCAQSLKFSEVIESSPTYESPKTPDLTALCSTAYVETYPIILENEEEILECPWDLEEFLEENKNSYFIACIPKDVMVSERFSHFSNKMYSSIIKFFPKEECTSSSKWVTMYSKLNLFLLSKMHINISTHFFEVDKLSKHQNKFSTKFAFFIMNKEIDIKAKAVVEKQKKSLLEQEVVNGHLSSAAKSKLRYIAGACIHKISGRLKDSVLRNLGKVDPTSKMLKKFNYKKQLMLQQFRIREEEVTPGDDSYFEIEAKQGPSRGLFIVNDDVFHFFISLNTVFQHHLTPGSFHLHSGNIHVSCKNILEQSSSLIDQWISLFGLITDNDIENEILMILIFIMYSDVCNYFLKISISDARKRFKETVPRKKKQALRSKLHALGSLRGEKRGLDQNDFQKSNSYICQHCNEICEEKPDATKFQSIGCDGCNNWFHYKCVGVKGDEQFLKRTNSKWYCQNCRCKKAKGNRK